MKKKELIKQLHETDGGNNLDVYVHLHNSGINKKIGTALEISHVEYDPDYGLIIVPVK
jgi:hypothetical protein